MDAIQSKKEKLELMRSCLIDCIEMEETFKKIEKAKSFISYLDSRDIDYNCVIEHSEVLGCSESCSIYQKYEEELGDSYSVCKHILVHERKGDKTFLIVTDSEKQVDLSKIREKLSCRKLEFVKEDDMKSLLDTTPGNVSLFNMISDKDEKVELVFDKDLFDYELLAFHPLYNGMSMFISPRESFKFLDVIKRDADVIDVPARDRGKVLQRCLD